MALGFSASESKEAPRSGLIFRRGRLPRCDAPQPATSASTEAATAPSDPQDDPLAGRGVDIHQSMVGTHRIRLFVRSGPGVVACRYRRTGDPPCDDMPKKLSPAANARRYARTRTTCGSGISPAASSLTYPSVTITMGRLINARRPWWLLRMLATFHAL